LWTVELSDGAKRTTRYLILAVGCLSNAMMPRIEGIGDFQGEVYHTGQWPHEGVDFTDKRVAVIGTGSSAIQSIPQIARQASQVVVFQRTPNYSVPARNGPLDRTVRERWLANREENRELQRMSRAGFLHSNPGEKCATAVGDNERRRVFEERWAYGGFAVGTAFADLLVDPRANGMIADFVAEKIRDSVNDPWTADHLTPKDYPFGAKRLCVDTGYYETFNQPNVSLVDLRETPLERVTPEGMRTSGETFNVDAIVFAIGFDAMTGALSRIDIAGRGGLTLRKAWEEGPKSYLGLMVAGFPNLFTITGPGSPAVLANMVVAIEQHVDWICDLLVHMKRLGLKTIEAKEDAQKEWVEHVNERASNTLYQQANSWYLGANVPGKPRVFMPYVGGMGPYRALCAAVADNGYLGFNLIGDLPRRSISVSSKAIRTENASLG